MKNKAFNRYYILSCVGVLIASYYPLSMGVRVICDMIADGHVLKENYPKYIIPYTPISVAVIIGVLLMPLFIGFLKKNAFAYGAFVATGVFFVLELLFEQKVVVSSAETITKLEDWQMYMCYIPPEGWGESVTTYKIQTAVDILMGEYDPAFKLHFYIISVLLIVTLLNCFYGFGHMIKSGDGKRFKSLILQSICSLVFLGLCILACFTAFWRDGSIKVSPVSGALMTVFFVLFGVSAGVFSGSFLLGKRKSVSVLVPTFSAVLLTIVMYIAEMILLNGHLYSLGAGLMFESIPFIVLAPVDIASIVLSGCITALIFTLLNDSEKSQKGSVIRLSVVCVIITLTISFAILLGNTRSNSCETEGDCVKLTEKISDDEESFYSVGAYLHGTDISSVGKVIVDEIEQRQLVYSSMTEEERMLSSRDWGHITVQTDSWDECEKMIGNNVNNPLESVEWLDKTNHFGTPIKDFSSNIKHVKVTVGFSQDNENDISDINITSGYSYGDDIKITLNTTVQCESMLYQTSSFCNGYADYSEKTVSASSGIPVLIVVTDEANNNGYYSRDHYDPVAYWVKDNVFYSLRVFGDENDKTEITKALERILTEI